ncbi:(2Fe-2S) ferredoxin domain-containing protein [Desmospora profundinema]|uniref:(2Fe-2S) ferredoxin n=1 Tax=Desmospora profundinema TaxID=1571184 RepID=A0ABU1IR54_9BACL|nr:(2Fe-2S) ferredoxin domain-containing protein [Desmospora profundinema]MDR6227281.1 (2Fe-2S) ferredoxin [Desmospora profundinema]
MTTWDLSQTRHHILICNGGSCLKRGADEVTCAIRDEISRCGEDQRIHTTRTKCNGRCADACVVIVYPEGSWFKAVTPEIGKAIVREHLLQCTSLLSHISHVYGEERFLRQPGVPIGVTKEKMD